MKVIKRLFFRREIQEIESIIIDLELVSHQMGKVKNKLNEEYEEKKLKMTQKQRELAELRIKDYDGLLMIFWRKVLHVRKRLYSVIGYETKEIESSRVNRKMEKG